MRQPITAKSCRQTYGVEGTSGIEDIHIKERDQGVPHLAVSIVVVERVTDLGQWVECDDLLEEVEHLVSGLSVREVSDRSRTGPGNDGSEENADKNGTSNAVHHQKHREDTVGACKLRWNLN
jgi:hypothetical protein